MNDFPDDEPRELANLLKADDIASASARCFNQLPTRLSFRTRRRA